MKFLLFVVVIFISLSLSVQTYDTNGAYVETFVGSGFQGLVNGQGQQTMFYGPLAVATDIHPVWLCPIRHRLSANVTGKGLRLFHS